MGKENKTSQKKTFQWEFYLVDLVSRVGVFGTVVIALLTLFIFRGTVAQHREFIDKFFLLKWGNDGNFYFYFIITGFLILFVAQYVYYKQRVKMKDERIAELTEERDWMQNRILKKFF
jgi:phosphoglycerol transferase MdoB-like AlkP superfamily enzyme